MKYVAYKILLKKYFLIDMGVLLLLITLPIYVNPQDVHSIILRAILYSGFITPVISYFEIKKSHKLPFFDNLNVSLAPLYSFLLITKIILSLSLVLYV
jgi:hypothetical protein